MSAIVRTFVMLLALALGGCAAAGLQATAPTMPIARAALAPEYRVFYDSMQEDGDWTLIEPWGYVFRPRVNFVAWTPYERGFWVPSDVYGWVWISTETFGWATYHYGNWLYDDYQGWVWIPGIDWGPAWVSWEVTSDFVGWAPLAPSGSRQVPLDAQRWAPVANLGSTDLSSHVMKPAQLGAALADARRVSNTAVRNGVTIERGPSLEWVERRTGPLTRVKLTDAGSLAPAREPKREGGAGAPVDSLARIEGVRRAAVDAAREARLIVGAGGPPPQSVSIVRPIRPAPTAAPDAKPDAPPRAKRASPAAPADTTRR